MIKSTAVTCRGSRLTQLMPDAVHGKRDQSLKLLLITRDTKAFQKINGYHFEGNYLLITGIYLFHTGMAYIKNKQR